MTPMFATYTRMRVHCLGEGINNYQSGDGWKSIHSGSHIKFIKLWYIKKKKWTIHSFRKSEPKGDLEQTVKKSIDISNSHSQDRNNITDHKNSD